jgi:integrase
MRVALTAALIERTVAEKRNIELRDTVMPGLICRVRPTGRKTFEVVSERRGERWSQKLGIWPHLTLKAARDGARRLLGEAAERDVLPERNVGGVTLREFSRRYFERVNLKAEAEARRVLETDWAALLDKPLREITRGRIEELRGRMMRAKDARWNPGDGDAPKRLSAATVNRKMTVLRAILSRAVEWNELIAHPMKGLKPLQVVDDARVRTLTEAERGRIYGVIDKKDCKPEIGTAIYILLNTGARLGELRGLRAEDVDLKGAKSLLIRATTSKTAKSRRIPINATLADRLKHFKTWRAPTRKEWDAVMARARVQNFTPHHARHDFLSRLANAGVAVHIVSQIAGHSSIALTGKYYLHTSDDAVRAAVERF